MDVALPRSQADGLSSSLWDRILQPCDDFGVEQKVGNMGDPLNVIVDLSHHNGNVDLAQAQAAGIVGVIHKATQGTAHVDPMYQVNRAKAQDAGLLWGARITLESVRTEWNRQTTSCRWYSLGRRIC